VKDLKEGNRAVEERARYDLGMVGGTETFYQIIDQDLRQTTPDSNSAPSPVHLTAH
jgi:hypothetical protein